MNIYKTTAMLGMSLALFFCAPLFAAIKPRFEAGVSFGGGTSPVVKPKAIANIHGNGYQGRPIWEVDEDEPGDYVNYHFYGGAFLFEEGAPEGLLHEVVLDIYFGGGKRTLKNHNAIFINGQAYHHLMDASFKYKNEGVGILYHLYSPSYGGIRVYGGVGLYGEKQKIKFYFDDIAITDDIKTGNSSRAMIRPSGGFAFLPGFENSKIAGKIALELFAALRFSKDISDYGSDFAAHHESDGDGKYSGKTGNNYGLDLSFALIF